MIINTNSLCSSDIIRILENDELLRENLKFASQKRREKETKELRAYLYKVAKIRAIKYNKEFNIDETDILIPKYCPILGFRLRKNIGKPKDNSFTLDRIDNNRGYVKGNIVVLSYRANRLKSDGCLEEFKKIVSFIENHKDWLS